MTRHIDDTPNTPGTVGYDETKPATVSGSSPGRVAPKEATFTRDLSIPSQSDKHYVAGEPGAYITDGRTRTLITEAEVPRPWATGHCSYDIVGNVTDLRLSLTVDGVNYSGLVQRPSGQKEVAAMLRTLAEQVESGRA
jgi:hypothetical protein